MLLIAIVRLRPIQSQRWGHSKEEKVEKRFSGPPHLLNMSGFPKQFLNCIKSVSIRAVFDCNLIKVSQYVSDQLQCECSIYITKELKYSTNHTSRSFQSYFILAETSWRIWMWVIFTRKPFVSWWPLAAAGDTSSSGSLPATRLWLSPLYD